jgi:hypothetical protein
MRIAEPVAYRDHLGTTVLGLKRKTHSERGLIEICFSRSTPLKSQAAQAEAVKVAALRLSTQSGVFRCPALPENFPPPERRSRWKRPAWSVLTIWLTATNTVIGLSSFRPPYRRLPDTPTISEIALLVRQSHAQAGSESASW